MKNYQIQITAKGGPEVLQAKELDLAEPCDGEIRVKIISTGVAFADLSMRLGMYPGVPPAPFTPGYDIVGRVDSVCRPDSTFQIGDLVAALTFTGGYAQYINLSEEQLVKIPQGIDPVQASSIILNYVSAWQMLYQTAKVQPGEHILVHSAAGGVGTALLQLAKFSNLSVFGTASSGKLELVKSLGAIPIDYKNEDFVASVISQTDHQGVDVVFDGVGGNNLWRSAQCLKPGGRLVSFGFLSSLANEKANRWMTFLTFVQILAVNLFTGKKARFYSVSAKGKKLEPFKNDLTQLFLLLQTGQIQPVIGAQLPLSKAAEAHQMLSSASVSGKIVLLCE